MDQQNFIYPCFWDGKPCNKHARYWMSHKWPTTTRKASLSVPPPTNSSTTGKGPELKSQTRTETGPKTKTSILSLPTELIQLVAHHLSRQYTTHSSKGAIDGGAFVKGQVFPLTDRVCFAFSHPRLLEILGTDALIPHPAVADRNARGPFAAFSSARASFLKKLERDAWPRFRYCGRCDILHCLDHLEAVSTERRIQLGGSFYQLPVEYVKLAVQRERNAGKGGICTGLLECVGPQESFLDIQSSKRPDYPNTDFQFIPRARKGQVVKEVTGNGQFVFTSKPLSAMRVLVNEGPKRAYGGVKDRIRQKSEVPRYPVLTAPLPYEKVNARITLQYSIRLEIESNTVVLNGVFKFRHITPLFSPSLDSEAIRALDWRICPHTTMRYRVIGDEFVPTTCATPGDTQKTYQRACAHCRTYFRMYGTQTWEIRPKYVEHVSIRRELGMGRSPRDRFWAGDTVDKDIYDNGPFEGILKSKSKSH